MITHASGPLESDAGFISSLAGVAAGTLQPLLRTADQGGANSYNSFAGAKDAIVENTATTLFTVTVPNVNAGAGGRVLVTSVLTQASHIGDSTRTIEYIWSVTRLAGAVAVITISIITGGSAIATKAAGYTFASVLAATAVSGGATAVNTFGIQITNDASTDSTSNATFFVEILNYASGGVTLS